MRHVARRQQLTDDEPRTLVDHVVFMARGYVPLGAPEIVRCGCGVRTERRAEGQATLECVNCGRQIRDDGEDR